MELISRDWVRRISFDMGEKELSFVAHSGGLSNNWPQHEFLSNGTRQSLGDRDFFPVDGFSAFELVRVQSLVNLIRYELNLPLP